jgi:hypothetical protein
MFSFSLHALYRHDSVITKGEDTKIQGSSEIQAPFVFSLGFLEN